MPLGKWQATMDIKHGLLLTDCFDWKYFQPPANHTLTFITAVYDPCLTETYRTIIDRPRNMRLSSGVTTSGAGGGLRVRKWCFRPETLEERTSNHFADNSVKIDPLDDMPF